MKEQGVRGSLVLVIVIVLVLGSCSIRGNS
jgi:hypothetical protein